jgi:outer membrane protein assembly factor BamB/tetratricopeptide (TPR) repeat protein
MKQAVAVRGAWVGWPAGGLLALFVAAGWPALAVAQPPGAARPGTTFYPDSSYTAETLLRNAANHVRDGQWAEAIELYLRVIDQHGDGLAQVPRGGPPARAAGAPGPQLYVNARRYCQAALAALPPEGRALYRRRIDARAEPLYRRGVETGDRGALAQVVREMFASSWGDQALDRLGDLAFREGRFAEALAAYKLLLDDPGGGLAYPDPDIDRARVAAKVLLCRAAAGDPPAPADFENFRATYGDPEGSLAGRSGKLADLVAAAIAEDGLVRPPPVEGRWATFAGAASRNGVAPEKIDVGSFQWKVALDEPRAAGLGNDADDLRAGLPRRPRTIEEAEPTCFPIVLGDLVVVADEERVTAFHLDLRPQGTTDEAVRNEIKAWDQKLTAPQAPRPGRGAFSPARRTLTASGDRIFARLGPAGRGGGVLVAIRSNREIEGKLIWKVAASEIELPARRGDRAVASFEGTPVADAQRVYVALTLAATETWAYVACLDAETGRTLWVRYLGNAASAIDPNRGILLGTGIGERLLSLDGARLYYQTNMGALACLDAEDGAVRWLATYPVRDRGAAGPEVRRGLNPAVVDAGRVFIAPEDSASLLAFDADTGRPLWTSPPIPQIAHVLGVAGGKLFATGDRLYTLDAANGKVLRTWPEAGAGYEGYGRGLLAGDSIYWPTRTEVLVLDQATGGDVHGSIPLFQSFGHGGGNLASGDGYLVVAGRDTLVVFCQNRRLIERYRMQVVRAPEQALGHYQLARLAEATGEEELALSSLDEAIRRARPVDVVDGQPLADLARARRFGLLMKLGRRAGEARDWPEAAGRFAAAVNGARSPRERLDGRLRLADALESGGQPERAVNALQDVLADEAALALTVPVDPRRSVRADLFVAERLAALIEAHGRGVYAASDARAEALLARGRRDRDARALREIGRSYPAARVAPEALLALASLQEAEGMLDEATATLKRLLLIAPSDALRARALLGLAEAHEAAGFAAQARDDYLRLRARYGSIDLAPFGVAGTAGALAEQRLTRGGAISGLSAAAALLPLGRRWERRFEAVARPILAEGQPAPGAPGPLFLAEGTILRPVDAASGRTVWEYDLGGDATWVAHHGPLVLAATPTRVVALRGDTGSPVWQFDPTAPAAGGVSATPNPFARPPLEAEPEAATPPPAPGRLHGFQRAGSHLFALLGDRRLLAIDADEGRLDWSYAPDPPRDGRPAPGINPRWLLTPRRVVLQAGALGTVVVLDPETGQRLAEHALGAGGAEPAPWVGEPVALDEERVILPLDARRVVLFDVERGAIVWSYRDDSALPRSGAPRVLADESVLLVLFGGQELVRLDPGDGRRAWARGLGLESLADAPDGLAMDDARAYATAGDVLTAYGLGDGAPLWSRRLVGASGWSVAPCGPCVVAYPNPERGDGEGGVALALAFYRRDTGRLVQRLTLASPSDELVVRLDDPNALVATRDGLWGFGPLRRPAAP